MDNLGEKTLISIKLYSSLFERFIRSALVSKHLGIKVWSIYNHVHNIFTLLVNYDLHYSGIFFDCLHPRTVKKGGPCCSSENTSQLNDIFPWIRKKRITPHDYSTILPPHLSLAVETMKHGLSTGILEQSWPNNIDLFLGDSLLGSSIRHLLGRYSSYEHLNPWSDSLLRSVLSFVKQHLHLLIRFNGLKRDKNWTIMMPKFLWNLTILHKKLSQTWAWVNGEVYLSLLDHANRLRERVLPELNFIVELAWSQSLAQ